MTIVKKGNKPKKTHIIIYNARERKKGKGKPTQQNWRTRQATPTLRLTTCGGQHTNLHEKGKDCNGTNPHNHQAIRGYCSERRRKTQETLGERRTFINQSRTKLYTKLVRSCIPKSYEVAYQSRTRLVNDGRTFGERKVQDRRMNRAEPQNGWRIKN